MTGRRIALNLLYLLPGQVGGSETYAAGLIRGLQELGGDDQYIVFVNRRAAEWPLPDHPRFQRVICGVDGQRRGTRYAFEQCLLPWLLHRHRVDLVHSLGYVTPLITSMPRVVSVLDVNFRAQVHAMSLGRRLVLSTFVGASARRAAEILTLSEASKADIVHHLGVPAAKIRVTYLAGWQGMEQGSTSAWRPTPAPYFIAFGSGTANKNIPRLLEAWKIAQRSERLVLVGRLPAELATLAAAMGVIVTGYLDEARLRTALRGALALIFPSLFEGFGLPVLEAMGDGVPVAVSRASALPEVAGEAGLYFDPLDAGDIARQIRRLGEEPALRVELAGRGRAQAATFTWRRTAEATRASYDAVLKGR